MRNNHHPPTCVVSPFPYITPLTLATGDLVPSNQSRFRIYLNNVFRLKNSTLTRDFLIKRSPTHRNRVSLQVQIYNIQIEKGNNSARFQTRTSLSIGSTRVFLLLQVSTFPSCNSVIPRTLSAHHVSTSVKIGRAFVFLLIRRAHLQGATSHGINQAT